MYFVKQLNQTKKHNANLMHFVKLNYKNKL